MSAYSILIQVFQILIKTLQTGTFTLKNMTVAFLHHGVTSAIVCFIL